MRSSGPVPPPPKLGGPETKPVSDALTPHLAEGAVRSPSQEARRGAGLRVPSKSAQQVRRSCYGGLRKIRNLDTTSVFKKCSAFVQNMVQGKTGGTQAEVEGWGYGGGGHSGNFYHIPLEIPW